MQSLRALRGGGLDESSSLKVDGSVPRFLRRRIVVLVRRASSRGRSGARPDAGATGVVSG